MEKDHPRNKDLAEIHKIRDEIENEDKIFYEELPHKYALLESLTVEHLRKICTTYLGRLPTIEHFKDESGNNVQLPNLKEDFIHFIIEEMRLSEIRKHVSSA